MTKILDDLQDELIAQFEAAGSMKAFAAKHGFSPQFLSDVKNGKRDASPRLCQALGLERFATVGYRRVK